MHSLNAVLLLEAATPKQLGPAPVTVRLSCNCCHYRQQRCQSLSQQTPRQSSLWTTKKMHRHSSWLLRLLRSSHSHQQLLLDQQVSSFCNVAAQHEGTQSGAEATIGRPLDHNSRGTATNCQERGLSFHPSMLSCYSFRCHRKQSHRLVMIAIEMTYLHGGRSLRLFSPSCWGSKPA